MDKAKVQHLFCQHCRAIQKVMDVTADCLYNPLDQDAPAFCASNEDFITAFSKLFEPPDDEELREKIAHVLLADRFGITVDGVPEYIKYEVIGMRDIEDASELVDQILLLIGRRPPDEELKKELKILKRRECIDCDYKQWCNETFQLNKPTLCPDFIDQIMSLFGDIRGQERERFVREFDCDYPFCKVRRDFDLEALKGGTE